MTRADDVGRHSSHELTRPERLGPVLAQVTGDDRWQHHDVRLVTGGKSNLTFELSCGAGSLILRRPPTGHLLPRAHDMGREARVQRALEAHPGARAESRARGARTTPLGRRLLRHGEGAGRGAA